MGWDDVGVTNQKQFKRTRMNQGKIIFRDKTLDSKWVMFKQDFEDGYGRYQKGQTVEITNKEKLRLYLEEGIAEPCEPEKVATRDPYVNAPRAEYKFLESVGFTNGAYEPGKIYELPIPRGDKYAERGLCVKVTENEVRGKRPQKS